MSQRVAQGNCASERKVVSARGKVRNRKVVFLQLHLWLQKRLSGYYLFRRKEYQQAHHIAVGRCQKESYLNAVAGT